MLTLLFCIYLRTASVILALPCSICPINLPLMIIEYSIHIILGLNSYVTGGLHLVAQLSRALEHLVLSHL